MANEKSQELDIMMMSAMRKGGIFRYQASGSRSRMLSGTDAKTDTGTADPYHTQSTQSSKE